ncbi:hypothetical protein Desku_0731 [Desulfofundulus kuznetsovii DSM 6115]|uniref:Uncharacterized protein n=1 Tax=Desulfofundulus kuznetsovii (strain DSM 6115 / VKM B-1805 / 17) TaxID=760568 RepID=A0AAU8Q163_DESK7|nr:hypothetical protein Desku_0731 [Desulfofundulus kuznetsovii DSM 6115]
MVEELLGEVIRKVKDSPGAEFADIFTPDVVSRLAALTEREYESFKVQLEAHLIMSGLSVPGMTEKKLDRLVQAAAERIDAERSKLPAVLLLEQCPGAPGGEGLYVPPGWYLSPDGVFRTDEAGVPSVRVCRSPLYVSAKVVDLERKKVFLQVTAHACGRWHSAAVPASLKGKLTAAAVKNMGVLVEHDGMLTEYIAEFLRTNWDGIRVVEAGLDLYAEFAAFVEDNIEKFRGNGGGKWGRFGKEENGRHYVAVVPEVAEKFARRQGTTLEYLLLALEESGKLLAGSRSRLRPTWFNGRTRRMVVVQLPEDAGQENDILRKEFLNEQER